MLYNAPYYFAKKQLLFELLVPSLGRYVPMQHTEYDLRTVGGEGKTNDVFKFSYHFYWSDAQPNFSSTPL